MCFYSWAWQDQKDSSKLCRGTKGAGSRQDGKVNGKKEKCRRGRVQGNVKGKEMAWCESSLVHSVTVPLHWSHHLTVTYKGLAFIAFMLFTTSR